MRQRFLTAAAAKHDNRYNYDNVIYVNANTKVEIICSDHGSFWQIPRKHISGQGCPKCAVPKVNESRRFNQDRFIAKSVSIHGDKYDYSLAMYTSMNNKVSIICKTHGVFKQTPASHLQGHGCAQCASRHVKMCDIDSFVSLSRKMHGDLYDYSRSIYTGSKAKTLIICKLHGEFYQSPANHISGSKCPKCNFQKMSFGEFLRRAAIKHGDKYEYTEESYKDGLVDVICKLHGVSTKPIYDHLNGSGCRQCSYDSFSAINRTDYQEFVDRSNVIHNKKYDYSDVEYINNRTSVSIICPIHGEFRQCPKKHLIGQGCIKCGVSSQHLSVCNLLDSLGIKYDVNNRTLISPLELDILINDYKIAIEINGLYWHSTAVGYDASKHNTKYQLCNDSGVKLLQFYDYEIINKTDIVSSIIKHNLNLSNKLYARNCDIVELSHGDYAAFMNRCHLAGSKPTNYRVGLLFNDRLVSCMSFNKHHKYGWEITRFANELGLCIVGGASKLFKHFVLANSPRSVLTYADKRISNANVYLKLGFKYDGFTKPNYYYVKGCNIYSRLAFQKHKLAAKLTVFDPNISESKNMAANGYHKLWDAGHHRLIWGK